MNKLNWKIGNVEITAIQEITSAGELIQGIIPEASPENVLKLSSLTPHFSTNEGKLKAVVQSFLVKSNGKKILIDTCNGNGKNRTDMPEWGNLNTNYLEKIEEAGIKPEKIDIVLSTHFHFDHIGWNTIKKGSIWEPTFSNARYLFVKDEFDYWMNNPEKEIADDLAGIEDSIMPVVKTGLSDIVPSDYQIDENIKLVSTPGHTPGHISVFIESEGQKALVIGDLFYHPCQIQEIEWTAYSDGNPDLAIETRKKILSKVANEKVVLLGAHFPTPVAGVVETNAKGYIFRIL